MAAVVGGGDYVGDANGSLAGLLGIESGRGNRHAAS